jgi:hypothetical protein
VSENLLAELNLIMQIVLKRLFGRRGSRLEQQKIIPWEWSEELSWFDGQTRFLHEFEVKLIGIR